MLEYKPCVKQTVYFIVSKQLVGIFSTASRLFAPRRHTPTVRSTGPDGRGRTVDRGRRASVRSAAGDKTTTPTNDSRSTSPSRLGQHGAATRLLRAIGLRNTIDDKTRRKEDSSQPSDRSTSHSGTKAASRVSPATAVAASAVRDWAGGEGEAAGERWWTATENMYDSFLYRRFCWRRRGPNTRHRSSVISVTRASERARHYKSRPAERTNPRPARNDDGKLLVARNQKRMRAIPQGSQPAGRTDG